MGLRQPTNEVQFDPNKPFEEEEEVTLPEVTPEQQAAVSETLVEPQAPTEPQFDPTQPFEEEGELSFLTDTLPEVVAEKVILPAGEALEKFGAAPARAGVSAAIEGESPLKAFGEQFGQPPEEAPTARDIGEQINLSDDPVFKSILGTESPINVTPLDAGTVLLDYAIDPLNAVPGGPVIKGVVKGGARAAKGAIKAVTPLKVAEKASDLGKGAKGLLKTKFATKVKKFFTETGRLPIALKDKLLASVSGIPQKQIEVYSKNFDEVDNVMKRFGNDFPGAADELRNKMQIDIRNTITASNRKITQALEGSDINKPIDLSPIKERLESLKARLNPATNADDIDQINELVSVFDTVAPEGTANLKEFWDLHNYFMDRAKGAYKKKGVPFVPGQKAQQAAKQARSIGRRLINSISPEIKEANQRLSLLHDLDGKMNKRLIEAGTSEAALLSAGAGTNQRNASVLRRLGELTGTEPLSGAENISAARVFTNPAWTALDSTGKDVGRFARGAAIGALIAKASGLDTITGAALGGIFTSPAAVKIAIKTGKIPGKMANFLKTPAGNQMLQAMFTLKARQKARKKNKEQK